MTVTNRAYSLLEIKELDDDERVITGIASTPTPDRMADIVVPEGAQFSLPIPLLWQHRSDQPIGHVTDARITKKGIEIVAKIAKGVSEDIDKAWALIKSGLVRGLSIGFRGLDTEQIPNSWGLKFEKWEWLELSAVTIPANAEASITSVKQFDIGAPAASGNKGTDHSPVASGKPSTKSINLKKPQEKTMAEKKTVAEQIEALEAARVEKTDRMSAIMQKSIDEGRSTDEAEQEEFDGLEAEVASIDGDLKRYRALEKAQAVEAKPINATKSVNSSVDVSRGPVIEVKSKLAPGVEFARFVKSLAAAKGDPLRAVEIAKTHYPEQTRIHNVLKAAVAAGTTTDPTWAGALVDYQNFAGDFIEFLRPSTVIGKFGTGNIPSLFNVPFNVKIPAQTSGGDAYWVGEGAPKPLTKFDFSQIELRWAKVASIAVLTEELVRFSNPSADLLVRNALGDAIRARLDIDFIDPAKAAVANVSPASITNGVTGIPSTGNPDQDIDALYTQFITANLSTANGVFLMSEILAQQLARVKNPLGQREYPEIGPKGGVLDGLPVITSQYIPAGMLALVAADQIYLADDGQVVIDASREASLQMVDNPANNSGTATPAELVSLWQTNSIGIRAERYINWQKRRAQAVSFVTGANYGGNSGS
ncbi:phage major capsid protein [Brucella intermedia GD04153]|uniref:Phage major capsid protein n=1 Tax=Brucella intermedia GD04153 TaxID=2975438 RepID=A0AA42KVJ1_9HYPH|nr:phage major capsid protein [Brucella intermedia]MDH0126667.1 phage major capsid protein [Brucella intermedia GD04153]